MNAKVGYDSFTDFRTSRRVLGNAKPNSDIYRITAENYFYQTRKHINPYTLFKYLSAFKGSYTF